MKSYDLYGNRKFASTNTLDIDLTKDGTLMNNPTGTNVNLFYVPNSNSFVKNNSTSWYSNNENTLYDIKGNLVEDVSKVSKYFIDKLPSCGDCEIVGRCEVEEIYSASKFGFDNNLPTVVGQNTKYNELDFCSFEENSFNLSYNNTVKSNYFGVIPNNIYDGNLFTYSKVNNTGGHTGLKSLLLTEKPYFFQIKNCNVIVSGNDQFVNDNQKIKLNKEKSSLNNFNFIEGKKYKLEFWVKSTESFGKISQNVVKMIFYDKSKSIMFEANNAIVKTNKIEGWQLIELSFDVPKNYETADLMFYGGYLEARLIDDIKISPSDAQSKSYVYDPKSLKILSELDENHFATFYDYDEAGNLIRVRKETEKGIVTIKESNIFYQTKK